MNAAAQALREHPDLDVLRVSDWVETRPVGGPTDQPLYQNGAIVIETSLEPASLLRELLAIERGLGRTRNQRWGPRSVDLDLLLYGQAVIEQPGLSVPHPWMAIRRFVLEPATQIAPTMQHPVYGKTLEQLYDNLNAVPFVIAVVGARTTQHQQAIAAAAKAAGADICLGASFPDTATLTDWRKADRLREVTLAFLDQRARTDPAETGPVLFDFWWWESIRSPADQAAATNTDRSQSSRADATGHIAPKENQPPHPEHPQLNLLVELVETGEKSGIAPDFAQWHPGPTLRIPADSKDRIRHDLTAALQGIG